MISCSPHPDGRRLEVTFTVTDPARAEHRIDVVGDFNGWDPAAGRMHHAAGTHTATLALVPGRYRFRYLDNHDGWFNDHDTGAYEYNEFGQRNCVLDLAVVDPPPCNAFPEVPPGANAPRVHARSPSAGPAGFGQPPSRTCTVTMPQMHLLPPDRASGSVATAR